MKLLAISMLLLIVALDFSGGEKSIAQEDSKAAQSPSSDPDTDEIYAAILEFRVGHAGEGPQPKQFVLMDTTTGGYCLGLEKPEDCAPTARQRLLKGFGPKADVDTEAVEDYLRKNAETIPVSRTIPANLPQVFISKEDEEDLFKRKGTDGWQLFYRKYPKAGGITSFSRVGFNKSKDCAVLYSSISCGWLCGTGHYHILKKQDGKWKLAVSQMLWIS